MPRQNRHAGSVIDHSNGLACVPGIAAQKAYSSSGTAVQTMNLTMPTPNLVRNRVDRRKGRCNKYWYVPWFASHAACQNPNFFLNATATTENHCRYSCSTN